MKAVILAGGLGTRLSEETASRPKPMVEIGGKPILWHILKLFSHFGVQDFIICCGFKGEVIKDYFKNFALYNSDVSIDLTTDKVEVHLRKSEPWRVTLAETGANTQTGGRIRRIRDYIAGEPFCMTYGDGLSDVNISALIEFHSEHGKKATVTAVQPSGRFGALDLKGDVVTRFVEKPLGDRAFINGGFFVLDPSVIDLIEDDQTVWEQYPLEKLAERGELRAFTHRGFFQPMDTLRDKHYLESLWNKVDCPWRIWGD